MSTAMDVKIEASWKEVLKSEFSKPYFQQIPLHIKTEKSQGKVIYPPVGLYRSFNFSISPKASILQDLKINRTRSFTNF